MSNPRELFRQAERRRAGARAPVSPEPKVEATPLTPMSVPPEPPARQAVSRPIRENSVYRQLMRSHDRMHSRHIDG